VAQVAQVIGALLILVAYAAAQFGMLDHRSYRYIVLNLVGATALALLAWHEERRGSLPLEGVVGPLLRLGPRHTSARAPSGLVTSCY
jgi:hypothetical protein